MDDARWDEHDRQLSEAPKARKMLLSAKRPLGDSKHPHKNYVNDVWIRSRLYDVTNWDEEDVPIAGSKFQVISRFDTERKENGIREMFHFRFSGGMKKNTAAIRRIPCACPACLATFDIGWKTASGIDASNQPMYATVEDCYFKPAMQGLNKWQFVTVSPIDHQYKPEELNVLYEEAITRRAMEACKDITVGGYGAVGSDNPDAREGYYLAEWKGLPFTLQEDTAAWGHSNNAGDLMEKGSVVCEAVIQRRVRGSPGWWETPDTAHGQDDTVLVPIDFVVSGEVEVEHAAGGLQPPVKAHLSNNSKRSPHNLKFVDGIQVELLVAEIERRDQLETIELDDDELDEAVIQQEQEEAEEVEEEELEEIDNDDDEYICRLVTPPIGDRRRTRNSA